MSAAIQHVYQYPRSSSLTDGRLRVATSSAPNDESADPFVRARVAQPRAVAMALRLVSDVVRSRHHIPPAMLERILLEADPVLTWGEDMLRVEGFSSCCGIYVRADIHESALAASELRPGTTNVDFNAGMRAALGRIRDGDDVNLEIGDAGVEVDVASPGLAETVIERKVKLPLRWLRGFVEVQAIQSRMVPRMEFDRAGSVRFFRALPRSGRSSDAAWVVPAGRSARLGSARRAGSVRVAGMSRLRSLEPGLPLCRRVAVYEDPKSGATAWRLQGEHVSLTVVLSPETWRGFSGEGQVLSQLATVEPQVARIRSMLRWQSSLSTADLTTKTDLEHDAAHGALAWLATRGLVGFDVGREAWFHRVLPFDLKRTRELIDSQHPRLKAARKLVEVNAVSITEDGEDVRAIVMSNGAQHRVRLGPAETRCTCPWFAKHQGERGPCKHVLAVEMVLAGRARS